MAFDGVPIGASDGLPKNGRFCHGRARVSGCPGLENAPGAVGMLLVPLRRQPARPSHTLGRLRSLVDEPHSLGMPPCVRSSQRRAVPYRCQPGDRSSDWALLLGSEGAFAWYFPLSFGACGKQTGSRFFLTFGNRFGNGNRFLEAFIRFYFAFDFRLRQGSTASGSLHVIRFEGDTNSIRTVATAEFHDRYAVGQQAPHGQVGSGRYTVTCYNSSGQRYPQSWSWRLFRDCPGH